MNEVIDHSIIYIFIDDEIKPIAQLVSPVNFELDTTKLVDGRHTLKIVSRDPSGKEGIRLIPFEVRNGPAIDVEGIEEEDVVDGIIPVLINAYGKGDQRSFLITGSETPQSIPTWVWILIVGFIAWASFYLFTYLKMK